MALCHSSYWVRTSSIVLLRLSLSFFLSIVLFATQNSDASSLSRTDWECTSARDPHRLVVKFHEDTGLQAKDLEAVYPVLLGHTKALFTQSTVRLEKAHQRLRMGGHTVEDLTTYAVIEGDSDWLDGVAVNLLKDSRFEHVYRDFLPQSPPMDIPPETPLFESLQVDHQSAPIGFGWIETNRWTTGSAVRIVNVEYSYDPLHEDLQYAPVTHAIGWDVAQWQYHGNGVLGQLIATDNAYGVTGAVSDAEVLVVSPYPEQDVYNVATSLIESLDFLTAGDVILIEQQSYGWESYAPIEYIPAVFDAIQWAVAEGVSVVEPSANGAADLDAEQWEGWFDVAVQDSGAIMVGGSGGIRDPLVWSGGSSYGTRIDVQGWFEGIVTTSTSELADLYFPAGDSRQSYTQYFGGTSGASPQIVSVIASFNSAVIEQGVEPWSPLELRALLRQTGRSQPFMDRETLIGSQPDASTLLRMWAW